MMNCLMQTPPNRIHSMKTKLRLDLLFLALLSLSGFAHGQGTAFTYQGRLMDNGMPANAIYDLPCTPTPAAEPSSPGQWKWVTWA
jgi:hypothetical protein